MKLRLWITVIFTLGTWFLSWLWVQSDGEARKIAAQAILSSVSTKIVNLDSHLANTLTTIPQENRDGVFLLEVIDDDFGLVKREVGSMMPQDEGAMYYSVTTTRGEYYLRVNNRYFLENSGVIDNFSKSLNGYAIINTPSESVVNRQKIRDSLGIGDSNYLYYRKVKDMPGGHQLMVAAYINKPIFYKMVYPENIKEFFFAMLFMVSAGFFINLLIHLFKLLLIKTKNRRKK